VRRSAEQSGIAVRREEEEERWRIAEGEDGSFEK